MDFVGSCGIDRRRNHRPATEGSRWWHWAETLAAYDDAIALVPGESGPHHNRGILLAEMGELDGALAELDHAEGLDPDGAGEGRAWAGAISPAAMPSSANGTISARNSASEP
jgi:hypothetical protein